MTAPALMNLPPALDPDPFVDEYFDQHDRCFASYVVAVRREKNNRNGLTQDRTGYLDPVGFRPPWMLPHEYIQTIPRERGRNRIFMDYDSYIADTKKAYTEWEVECRKGMQVAFGKEYRPGMAVTPAVLAAVGPAPRAWQPADAARKGNKWILFGEGVMPEKLAQYFPAAEQTIEDTLSWDDEPPSLAVAIAEDIEDDDDKRQASTPPRRSHHRAKPREDAEEG